MSPKVSVVMSVYNGERYLHKAVDSIFRQTFTDFEFIIIDDGSTDGTGEILKWFRDDRVLCVRNEENLGLTRSLNKGLALARGEYIARMDADDISMPERLQRQVEYLDQHPHVGLVGVTPVCIDSAGSEQDRLNLLITNEEIQAQLAQANCFCHGSVMFRRECLDAIGFYDETFLLAQDYDLWLRIAELFDVANLPEPLYRLREHNERLSETKEQEQLRYITQAREQAAKRRFHFQERVLSPIVSRPDEDNGLRQRATDRRWVATRYFLFAMGQRRVGDRKGAARFLLRALATYPLHFPTWSYLIGFAARTILRAAKAILVKLEPFRPREVMR